MKIDEKVIYEGCDLHVSFNLKGMKNLPEKFLKSGMEVDVMTVLVCCIDNCSLRTMRNVLEVAYLKKNPHLPKNWGEKVLMEMLGEHITNVLPVFEKYFNDLDLSEREMFVRVMLGIVVGIDNLKNGKVKEKNVSKCGPQPFLYQLLEHYELRSIWIPRWVEMWSILSLSLSQELTKQEHSCFQYIAKIDKTKSLFNKLKFLSEQEWMEKGFQSWEIANNYSECVGVINMFKEQMDSHEMQRHNDLIKKMNVKGFEDIKRVCLTNDISNREKKALAKRDISDSNAVFLYLTNLRDKENVEVEKYIDEVETLLEKCFERKDFFSASYMLDGLVVTVDYLNRIIANNKRRIEDIFTAEKITKNLFQITESSCCLNIGVWANLLSMNELTMKSVNHEGFKILHAKYEEDSRSEMRNILMEVNALNQVVHEGSEAKSEEAHYELLEIWKNVLNIVNEIQDEAIKRLVREVAKSGEKIKINLELEKRENNCPLLLMSFTSVRENGGDEVFIKDLGAYEDMALLGVEIVLTNGVYNLEPIRNRVLENQMKRDIKVKDSVATKAIKILKF